MSDATVVDAPAAPVRPNLTPAQMIEKYLALRDKKAALEAEHKNIIAPYNLVMGQLENFLLDDLNNAGGNSLATDAGTCYRTTVTSATVENWTETLQFIKDNEKWELLEARVGKKAVLAEIEESAKPVPGVKVTQMSGLNVRRA